MTDRDADLPLRYVTPPAWAPSALLQPLELLNDHAHLEKKAATNALELLTRWPEPNPPENWVAAMTAVARDEVEHLAVVSRLLARRGGRLAKQHANPYASGLHALVRRGRGPEELVDRLMISALIEARSCERFRLLGEAEPLRGDAELRKLYRGLWASEHGHYRTFVQLAEQILPAPAVAKRWAEMLDAEAVLIQRQPPGPRMHGGLPCIRGDGEKERTSPAKRTSFISRAGDGPTRIGASCKASNPDAPPTSLRFRTPRR